MVKKPASSRRPELRKRSVKAASSVVQEQEKEKEITTLPPRQVLALAATGAVPVNREALQGLLAEILVETDDRRRVCAQRADELLEMVFAPGQPVDPEVALALVERLQRIAHTLHTEEIHTAELASRLGRNDLPMVKVHATQVNVAGAQQIVGDPNDLGRGHDDR